MSIREYTKADLPAIFTIYGCSKLDELRFENKTFTLLPLEKDNVRLGSLLESKIYIYQKDNHISGYGAICGKEIRALFVHPEYRGEGIARRLFEYLLSHIHGVPYLYVARSNWPAKYLYEQYGFSVIETFETTYNQEAVLAQKMIRTDFSM